jgi:DNA polymerase
MLKGTTALARFIFQDFETQSDVDLTITGGLRYVLDASTRALLWSWGIDEDPIKLWCPDLSGELAPEVWAYVKSRMAAIGGCPAEVVAALAKPDSYIVGWNENFDRNVWRQVATPDHDWPRIEIEQTLDAMAQAQASNLPGQLDWAGRMLNLGNKTLGGKAVMKRFANRAEPLPGARTLIDVAPNRAAAVEEAIKMWALYLDYSVQDTDLMRAVWKTTRPLDADEWKVYWASEHINDRGMMVDLDVCRGAVAYREEEAAYTAAECLRLTDGAITSPTLTKQINEWVFDRLPDDLAEGMIKERDEEGYVTRLTGDKGVMTRLLEDIAVSDTPPEDNVVELLELLQFGRSSSAVKFEKMLNQEVDSRIYGQYVFNGAGQTHRWSARGIQTHNLPRAYLENELDVLDMVAAQVPIEELRQFGPVSSTLAKLIRPTIIAPEGKTLVWADYSAVEARVVAWLAKSRAATEAVIEPFEKGEDLYLLNAEAIFNVPRDVLAQRLADKDPEAKAMRQAAKVAVLALSYNGGVGAYKAMARGYGMRVSTEDAQIIVDGWRDRNRWARQIGEKIQDAMFHAMNAPLQYQPVGRVQYVFFPDLMRGTLAAILPDGRPIVYPMAKIVKLEKFGNMVDTITYLNGMGRSSMWRGLALENLTQSAAAGLLRDSIVQTEMHETVGQIIGHTHDEILLEAPVDQAEAVSDRLVKTMTSGFAWTEGLPLAAEPAISWYYSKGV